LTPIAPAIGPISEGRVRMIRSLSSLALLACASLFVAIEPGCSGSTANNTGFNNSNNPNGARRRHRHRR
jgi:hypothetical protein